MFRKPESISAEELQTHYLKKADATVLTACRDLSCSYRTLRTALRRFGLEPKDKTRKFGASHRSPLLSNRVWLTGQLKAKTTAEIAKEANRTIGQVHKWLKKHGLALPPRTRSASKRIKRLTREQLERTYVNVPEATMDSAGRELGVSRGIIARELARHRLPMKPRWRNAGRKTGFDGLHDVRWLRQQLESRSLADIAREVGTNASNVQQQAIRQGILPPHDGTSDAMKSGIKKAGIDRRGANGANWRGGRVQLKTGYIYQYKPDHPYSNGKYVMEHRLVMEQHLGRYLEPTEVVHHKNGIKDDNRIENLELLANTSEHIRQHFENSHRVEELESEITRLKEQIARLKAELEAAGQKMRPERS